MKKTYYLVPMLLALLMLCSCDKYADVKQFVAGLSAAIEKNDKDAIKELYPDADKADSLALDYDAEKLQIEPNSTGDTLLIQFSSDKSITIVKDSKEKYRAVASHGLFVYSPERLSFAKKTGQFVDSLDDISNAERMADEGFQEFLAKKAKAEMKGALKIVSSKGCDYGEGEGGAMSPTGLLVTVENQSNAKIEGKTYRVIVTECDWALTPDGDWDPYSTNYSYRPHTLPGKDIMPGEQLQFKYSSNSIVIDRTAKLQILDSGDDPLASYTPKGGEYEEYLSTK